MGGGGGDRAPSGMKCDRDRPRGGGEGLLERRMSCGEMGALKSGSREGLKRDKHTDRPVWWSEDQTSKQAEH